MHGPVTYVKEGLSMACDSPLTSLDDAYFYILSKPGCNWHSCGNHMPFLSTFFQTCGVEIMT